MHAFYYYGGVTVWPPTQQIPNKQTNFNAIKVYYYSVSATCFTPAGSFS
jgi:hypothetical protein